jgi:hypothetical protein
MTFQHSLLVTLWPYRVIGNQVRTLLHGISRQRIVRRVKDHTLLAVPGPELCYALFDRSPDPVAEESRQTDLDQDWFWDLAARYGVGLAP